MRKATRWAVAGGLLCAATLGPLGGTGTADSARTTEPSGERASSSLYAPSALVLTVAPGTSAKAADPQRAVTLSCAPKPHGTHPNPAKACAELREVGGDFGKLSGTDRQLCTKEHRPTVVTAQGVWKGKRVHHERSFGNPCEKKTQGRSVFAF